MFKYYVKMVDYKNSFPLLLYIYPFSSFQFLNKQKYNVTEFFFQNRGQVFHTYFNSKRKEKKTSTKKCSSRNWKSVCSIGLVTLKLGCSEKEFQTDFHKRRPFCEFKRIWTKKKLNKTSATFVNERSLPLSHWSFWNV